MVEHSHAGGAMKQLVVISGKGGTGKTSITAALAALMRDPVVLADCDVDAADLYLLTQPKNTLTTVFKSGHQAAVRPDDCTGCGTCLELCRFDAVRRPENGSRLPYRIDPVGCEGCGVCARFCPSGAIDFVENICGEWYVSETRFGVMVHARLGVAAENSGKLVTLIRDQAAKVAEQNDARFVLIDGSPGIGCPVIASLTAADAALIVTEPTVSGYHDLVRIAGLTKKLRMRAMVCVNKWDLNPQETGRIKAFCLSEELFFAGVVRYDKIVSSAQREAKTLPEFTSDGVVEDIRKILDKISGVLQ